MRSASSSLLWRQTDDLRLYGWVQFFPCVVLPLVFWLFTPKYSGTGYWFAAAGCTCWPNYSNTSTRRSIRRPHVMAGHALKHVAAAGACYAILLAFQTPEPIG